MPADRSRIWRAWWLGVLIIMPACLTGCGGGTPDGSNVVVGESTKSEVRARAAAYKARAALKKNKTTTKKPAQ